MTTTKQKAAKVKSVAKSVAKPIPWLVSKDGTEMQLNHYWWTEPTEEKEVATRNGYVIDEGWLGYDVAPKTHDLRLIPAATVFGGTLRVTGLSLGRSAANMRVEVAAQYRRVDCIARPESVVIKGDMQLTNLVTLWNNAVKGEVLVEVKAKKVGQNYLLELVSVL